MLQFRCCVRRTTNINVNNPTNISRSSVGVDSDCALTVDRPLTVDVNGLKIMTKRHIFGELLTDSPGTC